MGCSLSGGVLRGFILMCPCHDWRFDIRTGAFFNAPEIKLQTYPVKAEGGKIYVDVGAAHG